MKVQLVAKGDFLYTQCQVLIRSEKNIQRKNMVHFAINMTIFTLTAKHKKVMATKQVTRYIHNTQQRTKKVDFLNLFFDLSAY